MLILFNGHIHTPDFIEKPSAIAINNGIIEAIGPDEDILNLAKTEDKKIDLAGKYVFPGFTDAHIHMKHYALQLNTINCETNTRAECLDRVRQKASLSKPGKWILGHGWNHNIWPEGYGTSEDLDKISPNNPVFLTSKSLHAAWINYAAHKIVADSLNTVQFNENWIQKDHNGNPTGIYLEDAVFLIDSIIPKPDDAELLKLISKAQEQLVGFGITSIHDFDSIYMMDIYRQLQVNDELLLNIVKFIPVDDLKQALQRNYYTGYNEKRITIGGIKLFADGALGTQTAAMLEPYENDGNNVGMMTQSPDQIFERGRLIIENGFSIAIHAIGDKANRLVLDVYQKLRDHEHKNKLPHYKHRIEHVQLIHPTDQPRLVELDIIASMQPVHIHSDIFPANKYWGKRSAYAYPFNSLSSHNTYMIFGSDAPVESPNPFLGMHAASYRQNLIANNGRPPWYEKEKLSPLQAIERFSPDHVKLFGSNLKYGKLRIGYQADLIILDKNPLTISKDDLIQLKPIAAIINGKWIYQP